MTRALALVGLAWIAVSIERHRRFWAQARLW